MKLPLNCTAEYIEKFLSKSECRLLYDELIDEYKINTLKTEIKTPTATYYTDYGKIMFIDDDLCLENKLPEAQWGKSTNWPTMLLPIKARIQKLVNKVFHVCVCIYYPDGTSGVEYHSDYAAFGDTSLIPSLSIGEERMFQLREKKTAQVYDINLAEGSLLIMGEGCQENYEHSLPIDPKYKNGRINLTFRPYGL